MRISSSLAFGLRRSPGSISPSPPGPSATTQPDPQRWILETRPQRNRAGVKMRHRHCIRKQNKKKKKKGEKLAGTCQAEQQLTCAAQVDTRLLILSRCMSTVSLSVTCSDRHNSSTTYNNMVGWRSESLGEVNSQMFTKEIKQRNPI